MKGLFIHDHRFPSYKGQFLNSSGFDDIFTSRYLAIFKQFSIFGRLKEVDQADAKNRTTFHPQVRVQGVPSLKVLFTSGAARKQLKAAIQAADCCVVRLPSFLGLLALRYIKALKKPYLVEVVGCIFDSLAGSPKALRRAQAALMKRVFQWAVRQAPYVIYVTEHFLQENYPSRGKTIHCSNVELGPADEGRLRRKLERLADASQRIIRLGTTSTYDVGYKGQEYVIQALGILRKEGYRLEYELVGDGDPTFLRAEARRHGVEDQVRFLGRLPHNQVFDWLEGIDLYVHPSLQEGLARAIIEAMSCACPAVVSDAGGSAELIQASYVFPKRDLSALLVALRKILNGELMEQAQINFNKSKEYDREVLTTRRQAFYREFFQSFS